MHVFCILSFIIRPNVFILVYALSMQACLLQAVFIVLITILCSLHFPGFVGEC